LVDETGTGVSFFAVFDGHAGRKAADYMQVQPWTHRVLTAPLNAVGDSVTVLLRADRTSHTRQSARTHPHEHAT
jgi:hypothetical protein